MPAGRAGAPVQPEPIAVWGAGSRSSASRNDSSVAASTSISSGGGSNMCSISSARNATPAGVRAIVFTRRSVGSVAALHEAAFLQAIDEPGHLRGVAVHHVGHHAHGPGLLGIEDRERLHVAGGEAVFPQ